MIQYCQHPLNVSRLIRFNRRRLGDLKCDSVKGILLQVPLLNYPREEALQSTVIMPSCPATTADLAGSSVAPYRSLGGFSKVMEKTLNVAFCDGARMDYLVLCPPCKTAGVVVVILDRLWFNPCL